ncbi:cytochrome b5 reductase 4-like [Argonauta hians]
MEKSTLMPPTLNTPMTSEIAVGRNKVALKQCRSLMDWIRLTRSGKDLTSVGGKVQNVSIEELAKHNKENDAWMAIRGKVYNVTPYMEYHPGGIDELMRGVGKDGTQLFDEIHRWVNVNSMLEKCYVGPLKTENILTRKKKSLRNLPPPCLLVPPQVTKSSVSVTKPPSYDWFQSEASVTVVIYSLSIFVKANHVIVDWNDRDLHILVFIKPKMFKLHVNLEKEVTADYKVSVNASGAVHVVFKKDDPSIHWSSLGETLYQNYIQTIPEVISRECSVDTVKKLTHNTKLLRISLPEGLLMSVPTGYHLRVYHDELDVYRQYTPVLPSMKSEDQDDPKDQGRYVYLMVKIYEEGVLTSWINTLKSGSAIKLSMFEGCFDERKLEECTHLFLLAAGTGITPMVKLIYDMMKDPKRTYKSIKLMFFNKTEADIIWREEFDKLAKQDERFLVSYVLSQPDGQWSGPSGYISEELVGQHIPPSDTLVDQKVLICACGPSMFTANAMRIVRLKGYSDKHMHQFLG